MIGEDSAPEISFRNYTTDDLRSCSGLAEEAWPAGEEWTADAQGILGMEGYIESSLLWSNWTDLACDSQGVVGFLFGRIDKLGGGASSTKPFLREARLMAGLLLGGRWRGSMMVGMFWSIFLTELKLMVNVPRSDAAIELLIVSSKYRGKGIGRMLVDRFVHAARGAGTSLVTVYTDDLMSNWTFYEKFGFKRVGSFHDNVTSYFAGKHSNALIYVLDLKAVP